MDRLYNVSTREGEWSYLWTLQHVKDVTNDAEICREDGVGHSFRDTCKMQDLQADDAKWRRVLPDASGPVLSHSKFCVIQCCPTASQAVGETFGTIMVES